MFDALPFRIAFAPYIPLSVLIACAVAALLILVFTLWRRASGPFARLFAFAVILFVLANPQIVRLTISSQSLSIARNHKISGRAPPIPNAHSMRCVSVWLK